MTHLFKVESRDQKTGMVEVFRFTHTNHSFIRSAQRGIDDKKIAVAILYGEPYYKQGLIYYVLGVSKIPEQLQKQTANLRNTIVVVDGDSDTVLTCYRSKSPFKHIRKKSKTLFTRSIAA